MSAAAFSTLILCNLIWSAHPVLGKILLGRLGPVPAALARYGGALAAYWVVAGLARALARRRGRATHAPLLVLRPRSRRDGFWLAVTGLMPFCYAPALGMTALREISATQGALVIAMEPLLTVALARLFLGERLRWRHGVAFALALVGFSLLSGLDPGSWVRGLDPSAIGNLVLVASLIGEGMYSVGVRKLSGLYAEPSILGTALVVGVAGLAILALLLPSVPPISSPQGSTPAYILALFWLGPVGTALGYWIWMRVLKQASVASMTLTLFVQPVFGAIWGWYFLHDPLKLSQLLGGALILTAVGLQANSPSP